MGRYIIQIFYRTGVREPYEEQFDFKMPQGALSCDVEKQIRDEIFEIRDEIFVRGFQMYPQENVVEIIPPWRITRVQYIWEREVH